ncbi:MAG: four helix bundle protein [Candidatus Altimarinota bacterium]
MKYERSFRKLIAWQEAKKLALMVYELTKKFPPDEKYGMTSQLRRASSSIMANIAEGNERRTRRDCLNFFCIAKSSHAETDAFSELAYELKYLTDEEYKKLLELINKTGFLLAKLIAALEESRSFS